jgi:hypothetical protein
LITFVPNPINQFLGQGCFSNEVIEIVYDQDNNDAQVDETKE